MLLRGERTVLEQIATGVPLSQSLATLCGVIDELSGLQSSIFLLDRSGERLVLAAGPSVDPEWRSAVASVPVTEMACGYAVTHRRQVVSPEISQDPRFERYRDAAKNAGIRAVWSTPFFASYGAALGTFAVYSEVPGEPSPHNLELVSHATHLASIAVERHASEKAIQESEIRFSRAFYANPAAMTICSYPDDRVTYVNDAFVRMFGYSLNEVIGRPTTMLYVDPDRRAALLERLTHGGVVRDAEVQVRAKSGETCDVILSLERIDVLGERAILTIAVDITSRMRAEQELRKAIDAIPVQIWSGPADGTLDFFNDQWRMYTGLGLAEVQGDGWRCMLHPEDAERVVNAWRESVRAGQPYEQEQRNRAKDGTYRWFLCRGIPMRSRSGVIERWYGANTDITDRKRAEDARTAAEEELSQSRDHLRALAGKLMHAQDEERRHIARLLHETAAQDLAGLKMILARLSRTSAFSDSDRELLTESVQLADRVMTESRTLSYLLYPPFLDDAGLLSAIRWYVDGFSKRSGISVNLDLPDLLERLPQDVETTLFRVLQEALINIHHHAASQTADIRVESDAGELRLTVSDQGRGIPPTILDRVLSDRSLVGVGIAGMRERLNQLGGRLDISSSSHGTTIRALIPLSGPHA
jgi:PAS domain S-box-containing protein